MQTIDTETLQKMRFENRDMLLINTLSSEAFEARHIPDSVNVPQHRDDFVAQVQAQAGGKHGIIVVYSANSRCPSSTEAARKLDAARFENVYDYAGGIEAWEAADENVEVGSPSAAAKAQRIPHYPPTEANHANSNRLPHRT